MVFLLVSRVARLICATITCSLPAYSCVVSELLKLLEELVTVLVVYLSELLPLGTLDLFISVLPKPVP